MIGVVFYLILKSIDILNCNLFHSILVNLLLKLRTVLILIMSCILLYLYVDLFLPKYVSVVFLTVDRVDAGIVGLFI